MLEKLNRWTMDILKKQTHSAKLILNPKYEFTCYKCGGEWTMSDQDGYVKILERPYISCPHCRAKAKPIKNK